MPRALCVAAVSCVSILSSWACRSPTRLVVPWAVVLNNKCKKCEICRIHRPAGRVAYQRQDWSIDCPLSSKKTTKIPIRFCQPTLPKGWVYEEDIKIEESTPLPTSGPSTSRAPTTNVQHARHRQHPRDLNTTGGLPSSHSTSLTVRDERSLRSTSKST